jgi:hypothetical protein
MPVSPSNRYINFSAVSFTPTSGSPTTITGVQDIQFDENGEIISAGGDADLFDRFKALVKLDPKIVIETLDSHALNTVAAGTIGSLTFTINDARNGAAVGGGGKVYTISNAVLEPHKIGQAYRQFGKQTLTFQTFSTDGTTNPVAVAAA